MDHSEFTKIEHRSDLPRRPCLGAAISNQSFNRLYQHHGLVELKLTVFLIRGFMCLIFLCASFIHQAQIDSKDITTLGAKEGLAFEFINSIMKDSLGMVWISGLNSGAQSYYNPKRIAKLQRYNGISFNTITLPSTGYIEDITYLPEEASFACMLRRTDRGPLFDLMKFNPYDYSWNKVNLGSVTTDADNLSGLVSYESGFLLLSRSNDSIYINHLNGRLELLQKIYLSGGKQLYLGGNIMINPFDDHFLIHESNYGIQAYHWDGNFIRYFDNEYFNLGSKSDVGVVIIKEAYDVGNQRIFAIGGTLTELKYYTYNSEMRSFKILADHCNFILENDVQQLISHSIQRVDNYLLVSRNYMDSSFIDVYKDHHTLSRLYSKKMFNASTVYSEDPTKEIYTASLNGLHIIDMKPSPLRTALPGKSIRSIYPLSTDQTIVTCEKAGWYVINPLDLKIQRFQMSYRDKDFIPLQTRKIIRQGDMIWSNYQEGIFKLDLNSKKVETFRYYPINCMLDRGNEIIYGTRYYALMKFNKNTGKQTVLLDMSDNITQDLLYNSDSSSVYMATVKGLMEFQFNNAQVLTHEFEAIEGEQHPICLTRLNDSLIFVGTNIGVVYLFNELDLNYTTLYKDKLNSTIATILCDHHDNIWFNTFHGIVKFRMNEGVIQRYSTEQGLVHNESNRHSAIQLANDDIYIGSVGGLNMMSPELDLNNRPVELSLVTAEYYDSKSNRVKIINSPVELKNMDHMIVLPPSNRFLNLEFGTTKYIQTNEYTFEYKLNDNLSWQELNYFNKLQFADLSPGQYDLQVRIANSLGEPIGERVQYKIDVKRFFYQEWWFFLFAILSGISISYYFIHQARKERSLQKHFSQQLIDMQESELKRISREIHDSAGQNLVLLKLQAKIANNEEMQRLADATLEGIREISHNMHPFVLEKFGLTAALKRRVRLLDEQSDIFISQHIENLDGIFSKSSELHIYRIVQECLTNIVKHAQAQSVNIKISQDSKIINLEIADNGIGMPSQNFKSSHIGLRTIRERVDILGGEIEIQSKINQGTVILIQIPKEVQEM
jgi:signal transduction histidine kinase